jgi:hypothetical protein
MRKYYYNAEHYPDPTAYEALINITREERRRKRNRRSRQPCKPRETPGYRPFEEVLGSDA